jgi:hypothetical protein
MDINKELTKLVDKAEKLYPDLLKECQDRYPKSECRFFVSITPFRNFGFTFALSRKIGVIREILSVEDQSSIESGIKALNEKLDEIENNSNNVFFLKDFKR